MFSKLYSYYFSSLFRKNWIRLTLLTTLALVGTWFIGPLFISYLIRKGGHPVWKEKTMEEIGGFRELNKELLNDPESRKILELNEIERGAGWGWGLKNEQLAREAWENARQKGDKAEIDEAEKALLKITSTRTNLSSYRSPVFPLQELGYNELSLGAEPTSSGRPFWRTINTLSFWALTAGFSFSYLTIHLVNFLFLAPKKNGEEAMVLSFTPGVKRSDLLISKISVFLTYYILFGLVTFVLPGFFYYLW